MTTLQCFRSWRHGRIISSGLGRWCLLLVLGCSIATAGQGDNISCLGRIEPGDGVIHVSGPSGQPGVVGLVHVAEGDWVEKGQQLATLDDYPLRKAEVARIEAELNNARSTLKREDSLSRTAAISKQRLEDAQLAVKISEALLEGAKARLELAVIRAPMRGQVLKLHTRAGEQIGADGLLELGQTDRMYTVAEVYETDIGRVRVGQKAVITSPALPEALSGTVESIGLKVGKMDVLGTDPVAKADARVIEVEILLDDGAPVAGLTNLQVEVEIQP